MVPTRSTRSSSRRSSILKTPKRRQPLTKLNFDNSSNESSPATTKIKRRVSFAEKKHVKEFCNSVDQGTVWDNTYEEHDLSSISKVPCGSNEQQFEDKDVSKESVSIHRETSNVQFSCNDSVNEGVNVEQINVHVEDVVEDIRYQSAIIGAALSDQFHDAQENENVYSIDLQLKSNSRISGSISVYQDETAEMLGEVVELSRSRVHNLVCNEISSKSVQSKCMEFTQGTCNTEYLELNCIQNNRTEDIVKDKSINVQQFDAAKADVRCNLQSYYNETNRCSTNLFLEDKENRNILPDDSMEFTEVAQKFHRSTVIQKTPMNKYNNLTQDEITKVLNMSMEMTEAVPINVHSMISVQDRNETSFSNNFKKLKYDPEMYDTVKFDETRYCDDELMEFTTVVTTSPKSTEEINLELPKRSTQHLCSSISIRNETDIFPESCMTMTKVVSSLGTNNDCENVDSVMIKPASEKTVVFPNASMEITEAVMRARNFTPTEDLIKYANFVNGDASKSLPQVDLQKSMEFTEAVSRVQPHVESELLLKSMEITEAVPRPRTIVREEDPQKSMEFTEAVSRVQPHVQSELLLKSMEITEAVPRPQTLIREEDLQKSMEFTEAVSRVPPHVESELLLKSMEITEAVPRPQTLIREEDPQKSMEFTEAVSRVQPYVESETRLKSMEIIETPFSAETRVQKEDLQKSVEIVESVIQERSPIRTKDADVNLTKTERPLEKIANRGLTSLSNFEKNDATNFDTISNKQNCNMYKNLENDDAEGSVSIEIQTFANNKSSMALHESMQLENCASAVKTSNAEVACAALNSASSVNSEIKIPALTLTKSSHRRTYVIQPSINDCTFTVNRNRNSRHYEIDIDINNKEASSSQDDVQNSQNDEDFDVENSKEFMPSGLEDIESIKPPSFSCLNDLSNTPMNINEDQEFMEEVISLSKDNDNDHEHASKFEHPEANVLRNVPKSQTFLTKNSSAGNTLGNLKIEQEDRIAGTDVIPKPQLLDNGDINMDIQVLECSSSTINGDENSPPLNKEQNLRPTCTLNSKLENQIEVRSSPKIEPAHERELKESNDEPNEADAEHYTLSVEENVIRKLKVCAKSDDIIWEVFYEDLDKKKLFVIGFISCSLLVVVYLQERCNFRSIKEIKLISRLPEDADVLISMVHRLMIEKIDTTQLLSRFSVYDDILPLLDYISKEVKIVMDFMFDLERLKNLNLMEFTRDSVSFISQSDRKNIILKVTVNIKPFEKIGPEDVSVHSLFGSLRDDNALKKLITNVKRDHKFLRRFIQDVKSYISIEEDFLNQI